MAPGVIVHGSHSAQKRTAADMHQGRTPPGDSAVPRIRGSRLCAQGSHARRSRGQIRNVIPGSGAIGDHTSHGRRGLFGGCDRGAEAAVPQGRASDCGGMEGVRQVMRRRGDGDLSADHQQVGRSARRRRKHYCDTGRSRNPLRREASRAGGQPLAPTHHSRSDGAAGKPAWTRSAATKREPQHQCGSHE